jgi:hypothetical protein
MQGFKYPEPVIDPKEKNKEEIYSFCKPGPLRAN